MWYTTKLIIFPVSIIFLSPAMAPTSLGAGWQLNYQEQLARRLDVSPVDQLVDQAKSLLAHKRYDEAIPILTAADRLDPNSPEVHFYLGSAFYHKQDMERAIEQYMLVLQLSPQTHEAIFNIGSCYEHLHQFDQAISWYDRYLREAPDAPDKTDVRRNIEEIKKSIEVHKLFQQSHDLLERKRPLDARFLLEQAAALEPKSPEIHYNLGMAYHNTGNLARAIEEFQNALQLKPDMTDAMLNVGSCYQVLGQRDEAITWFQRYLSSDPSAQDHKAITDMIASLQKDAGKQSSEEDPHGPDFWSSISKDGLVRRWPQEKLPLKVFVDPGTGVAGMSPNFPRILIACLDAWVKASQGRIGYTLVAQKESADLTCDWTSNPGDVTGKGTESEQGVAHIYGKDRGTGVVEIGRATVRVLTIDKEKGSEAPVSDDVMKKTCLHEIGHALGLMGHSPNSHDIMFYSESPTVWPVLSKRDKATLLKLYEQYPTSFAPTPLASPSP